MWLGLHFFLDRSPELLYGLNELLCRSEQNVTSAQQLGECYTGGQPAEALKLPPKPNAL